MKTIVLTIVLTCSSILSFGQKINYNLDNGYIAQGYDVVAYFSDKTIDGKVTYSTSYEGAKYKFINKENLAIKISEIILESIFLSLIHI